MRQIFSLSLLFSTIRLSTPLVLAAIGGLYSERSGVINIALEGLLLAGAFTAASVTYYAHSPWVGLGSAMVAGAAVAAAADPCALPKATKTPTELAGIRAALCNEMQTARLSRAHNDANVLAMGARIIAPELAMDILRLWLDTPFEGGRHQRRLDQIADIEKKA